MVFLLLFQIKNKGPSYICELREFVKKNCNSNSATQKQYIQGVIQEYESILKAVLNIK
jgi:hypothetical protein